MSPCTNCHLSLKCTSRHTFSSEINKEIQKLYKTNNWRGLLALAYTYSIIAFAVLISQWNFYFYPLSLLLIGSRQRALGTILHESTHRSLCSSKQLAFILGTIFSGYLIFQVHSSYVCSHVRRHHKYLGSPEHDPDIQYYIQQGILNNNFSSRQFIFLALKTIFGFRLVSNIKYLIINRLFSKHTATHSNQEIKSDFWIFISFWSFLITFFLYYNLFLDILLFWLIPYFTVFQVINWFIELSEHSPLTKYSSKDIYMSRNRFSPILENFFMGMHGESYHLVHHLRPKIPFWNVKKAHKIFMKDAEYAKANSCSGGIFLKGTNDAPSILSDCIVRLKAAACNKR